MSSAWHGGKGSSYRKMDHQQFSDNWDRIFAKKKCLECGETNNHHTIKCIHYKPSAASDAADVMSRWEEDTQNPVTENGQDWL